MLMVLHKMKCFIVLCVLVEYSFEETKYNDQREWSVDHENNGCTGIEPSDNHTCNTIAYDPTNVVFSVIPTSERIDFDDGWTLANVSDVKTHFSVIKNELRHESAWVICQLADGWISGRGYHYKIGTTKRSCADKIVVKYNASKVFEVVKMAKHIPDSWRLASITDVQTSWNEVKYVLRHVSAYVICKLEDGRIGGRYYKYRIYKDAGGCGDKLIVNSGHVLRISMKEHQRRTISCPAGQNLNIRTAIYGKPPNCTSTTSERIVKNLCNGRYACTLTAENSIFGDPCSGVYKSLTVQYQCYLTDHNDFSCNFTYSKCHWSDDTTATFKWARHQGRSADQGDTGPTGDHTSGATGWYIYIDSSKPRKLNDVARLKSEMIAANPKMCLQFWYYMYGANVGKLTVYSKPKSKAMGKVKTLWTKSGTVGPHWRHQTIEITSETAFQLILEGTVGNGESGDIALDDLNLNQGSCPPTDECTFEQPGLCGWTIIGQKISINWKRVNPKSSSHGPAVDHTYGTNYGYYLTSVSWLNYASHGSWFQSGEYPATSGRCFSFWYVKKYGVFKVLIMQNKRTKTVWQMPASDTAVWIPARVTIISNVKYRVIFQADSYRSGNTIDDIMFTDGPCGSEGTCNFERGSCVYTNSKNANFDWLIGSGQTSGRVAPLVDHTAATAYGQYMFILPASKEIHESAVLMSETVHVGGAGKCLSFWYFMQGTNAGSLLVQMEVISKSLTTVWQLDGADHAAWYHGQVPLKSQQTPITIHFVGIRGLDESGKIAIDDISLADYGTSCTTYPVSATPWGCNFEVGICKWVQSVTDNFDWQLQNGTNKNRPTFAPLTDHTLRNKKGNYLYFDAYKFKGTTGTAALISPPISTNGMISSFCLSFSYYLAGHFQHSPLYVYTLSRGESKPNIWQSTLSDSWRWIDVTAQLHAVDQTKVVFQGERGKNFLGGVSIDDIEISYGDCPNAGMCTFEGVDICNWKAVQTSGVTWERKSASTLVSDGGPVADHTYNTKYGHFMFVNYTKLSSLQTVTLESNMYTAAGPECLQFFYYMNMVGSQKDTLTILIKRRYSTTYQAFQTSGTHKGWNMGQATVKHKDMFTVLIQVTQHGSKSGVMAFDDFHMRTGVCPPIGNCDFEHGNLCSWSQDMSEDDFDWLLGSGATPGYNTGPSVDHTTNNTGGFYAFIDSSKAKSISEQAILKSVLFDPTTGRCLSFWYNMYGSSVDRLHVLLKQSVNSGSVKKWEMIGNQGKGWKKGRLPIVSPVAYQILFRGYRRHGNSGDIAIDDIEFTTGKCSYLPPIAGASTVSPATSMTAATFGPTVGNNQVDCNFEKYFCPNWKRSSTRKEFNWERHQGETDTRDTGPHHDHTTKTDKGYYIYVDASPPAELNDTAMLINSQVQNKYGGCFEFWYHMYGEHVGTLSLYTTVKNGTAWQWFHMGTQGDQWKNGQIYINKDDGKLLTITFVGTRGNGYAGDIALDDISFGKGDMCEYRECTFEEPMPTYSGGLRCEWTNEEVKDDFDWVLHSGYGRWRTGTSSDHTMGTSRGHYVWLNSQSKRRGAKAIMISQSYSATPGQCFTFWYFMYGRTMGNLTLFKRGSGGDTVLWNQGREEGQYWRKALATVKSISDSFQLVFRGIVGGRYGDIAIDDILKVDEVCPLPGDCNFEDFILCEYIQDRQHDSFDWIRGHGSTRTNRTGPHTDHTKGDMSGHYYYINSAVERPGRKARFVSQLFSATDPKQGRCLQFYRHMYGIGIGTLNVYIKEDYNRRKDREILVWSDSGNQGNNWIQSQAPVFSNVAYRLIFEAIVGTHVGDIALDDINFSNYFTPCTYIPSNAAPATPPPTTITPADSNCTFDHRTLCRWGNLKDDDFDWYVTSYDTHSGTGPSVDHTSGRRYRGYFALINARYQKPNDTAVLRSPNIRSSRGSICFRFAYFMYGRDVNVLNIYSVVGGSRERIWSRAHDLGSFWRDGQVEIKGVKSIFHIEVEGIRGKGYRGDIAVDDFIVSDGGCPSDGFCDFEDSMCGYTYYSSKFHWERANDGTPSSGDGPKVDHTTGTALGNYIYIKTAHPRKEGDNAIIASHSYPRTPRAGVCFNFWYHLMGTDIGTINIYILQSYHKQITKLWTRSGDHGNAWKHGRVTIKSHHYWHLTYQILIEGIVGKNYKGDIAIDDIWIADDPCPHEGACDFESHSFCSWTNVPNIKTFAVQQLHDTEDWGLFDGTDRHGPSVDHTRGNANGVFAMFLQMGYHANWNNGQLISKTFAATRGQCLSFWYYMYNRYYTHTGALNVYMMSAQNDTLYSLAITKVYRWTKAEVGLYSQTEYKIVIEAYVNRNKRGYVSIDDINIQDGNCVGTCTSLPITARIACGPAIVSATACVRTYACCYSRTGGPTFPSCFYHPSSCQSIAVHLRTQCGYNRIRSYSCKRLGCCYDGDTSGLKFRCYNSPVTPTAFPSTLAPTTTPAPSQFDCTFEHGWCKFVNLKNDRMDWMMSQGNPRIGIREDHTLQNAKGHYLLHYALRGHYKYTANLQTPTINFTTGGDTACVRFWYHMHGKDTFNVYKTSGGGKLTSPIWFRPGDVPHGWNYAQVRVPRMPPFKITFQAIRGYGLRHHIALDDVSFINGPCPPTLYCDFENGDLCGWSQDASDDFDWSRGSGNTATRGTGPHTDHTYHTRYGTYLYTEGDDHKPGDKARIESFPNDPTDGSCVEFYYYMKGSGIGTLNVWIRRGDYVDKTAAWTLTGGQGGVWTRAFITVVEDSLRWKVIFEGVHGANEYSDIAIDDVHILAGACIPKGDCDFEDSFCGYQNARNNTIYWVTNTGNSLQTLKTAPKVDHTTGLPTGHFLSMIGGNWRVKKGQIISEEFQVNPTFKWCVQFWYYMFGDGEETLTVHIRYRYKRKYVYVSLFKEVGNHDDKWMKGKANITSGYNFQIVFEGNPSYAIVSQSILALDDIKVTAGECTVDPITTPVPCAVRCRDRTCISSDKVCDFFPDCAQGRHKTDMTDEKDCDQCNFEKGYGRWKDVSKGLFHWNRTHGNAHPTSKRITGPATDHTTGTALGYYAFTDSFQGKRNDIAALNSPVIRQTHSTCQMDFWYHMFGGHIGTLTVYILTGDRLTMLWKASGNKGDKWRPGTVYINRRVEPFIIKFKVERRKTKYGDIAIDDIKFVNCSLPTPSAICLPDHFLCRTTRACIPFERICDFTDDCGDGSDELQCLPERYPYRCNFEDGYCYWGRTEKKPKYYKFHRRAGIAHRKYGPYYDHTTRTVSGHYIAGVVYSRRHRGGYNYLYSRIGSGPLEVTSKFYPCEVRFYYYFAGRYSPKFNVKTRPCGGEGCNETTAWSTQKTTWYKWIRANVTLRSDKPFQVIFELKAQRFGAVLIDDVSFAGCAAYQGALPTPRPPPVKCHRNQFYCYIDNKCISSKYKCDYKLDCSDGQDEISCGPCDFTTNMCGYTAPTSYNIGFSRNKPSGNNGPSVDHTSQSKTGYFAITKPYAHKPSGGAILMKALQRTSPQCFLEFYYYYNSSDTSVLSVEYVTGTTLSIVLQQKLLSLKQWQRLLVAVGQPHMYNDGIVGVWSVYYTNRYRDVYTISNDGTVKVKKKKTTTRLDPSDNQAVFPSSQGWFKTDKVHRSTTWEYIRLKSDGTLELQHFCSDGCKGTYKHIRNYCCSGTGRKRSAIKGWKLEIKADHTYVAVDDIKFHNCSFPRPRSGSCNANQFKCKDGSCIDLVQVCNFVADCHDSSDEDKKLCNTYKGRCNFETGFCNWQQDQFDEYDWSRGSGGQRVSGSNASAVDHTTGTGVGYYLFIKGDKLGFSRLISVVFKKSLKKCQMRFFYHMSGYEFLTLSIGKKTINSTVIPATVKWIMQANEGNFWQQAVISFTASRNFQIIIEADISDGFQGDLAIDDISFSPECLPDPNASLQPEPPRCDPDGEFSCGDGQCIDISKICNFVNDCNNKADEEMCPSSCDLEEDDTCGWFNAPENDMDWIVWTGRTPSKGTGPPYDHTKGNKYGHFLYVEADTPTEVRFPTAQFTSPMYNSGSYDCKFFFWYHMYHAKVQDHNDAILNVLYRRNGVDTRLFSNEVSSGPKWKQAVVELPRCPDTFMLAFECIHLIHTKTDVSIDDWKFDCAEKTPVKCDATTQFQCKITKQCIPLDTVCDMDRNCCDGSDEHWELCNGYTRFDFESGMKGWPQLKDDQIDYKYTSGQASFLETGPLTDHTFQETIGKYIYIDATHAKKHEAAVIVSQTISATSGCILTFWYYMYGKDMGSLSVYNAIYYGFPSNLTWYMEGNQGQQWKKASVTLGVTQDFQIMFIATVGGGPLSDIALDDISFSPKCKLSKKFLPGGPTKPPINPCKPLFQCKSDNKCIPQNQVCDFERDCKHGEDESNVTCGYPQGFDVGVGFGGWKNALDYDYEYVLYHELKSKLLGAPITDARGDVNGSFVYLDVTNKVKNGKAILSSPVFEDAYSNCVFTFFYHMHGDDVGQLRIRLRPNHTNPTTLFDISGDQGDKWVPVQVAVGRRRHSFNLDIIAYAGGGDGGIGIDEINFVNCTLPPRCGGHSGSKFRCKNNLCIDKSKVCDFIDDCGDSSDEDPNGVCSNYIGCNFDDGHCTFIQNDTDDFQWQVNIGETPSANTGPMHDHTYQTANGIYMYTEASDNVKGAKSQIYSFPMTARKHGACNMLFYYYMRGRGEGQLNVYTMKTSTNKSKIEWSVKGDQGLGWKQANVDFSYLSVSGDEFVVGFEGVIGEDYEGDTAIDDVRFSPGCLSKLPLKFPRIQLCEFEEFSCKSNGNCRKGKSKCDGKKDCKDGSDEIGCGGEKFGKQSASGSVAGGVVGGLLVIILVAVVAFFVVKRRKGVLNLFKVSYDSGKQEIQPSGADEENETPGLFVTPAGGIINAEYVDTEYVDPAIADFSKEDLQPTTSIGNPLYQDPFLEGEDMINLDKF